MATTVSKQKSAFFAREYEFSIWDVALKAETGNYPTQVVARVEGPNAHEVAKKIARVLNDVLDGQAAIYNLQADYTVPKRRVHAKRNKEMRKAQIRAQRKFIELNKKENGDGR